MNEMANRVAPVATVLNRQCHPTPRMPVQFVIGRRCGRLGNRLVLFANFVALAAEHGYRVTNVTFHSYAELFETTRRDIYCRFPVPVRRSLWDIVPGAAWLIRHSRIFSHGVRAASQLQARHRFFDRHAMTLFDSSKEVLEEAHLLERIAQARLVFVYGWEFRMPHCVRRHAEVIRRFLRPVAAFEQAGAAAVEKLRQGAEVVVGVHVRHGDLVRWHGGRCFFSTDLYTAWMRQLAAQLPNRKVAFLVCSDAPRHAGEFPGLSVGWGPGSMVGDLCALANCDYIFGPVSTFSQWAAFYGNKPLLWLNNKEGRVQLGKFRFTDLSEIPR